MQRQVSKVLMKPAEERYSIFYDLCWGRLYAGFDIAVKRIALIYMLVKTTLLPRWIHILRIKIAICNEERY